MDKIFLAFDQILGQHRALNILKKAIKYKRLYPCYLFTGEEGVGKKKTALAFAMILNCDNGYGCMKCISCKKIEKGVHPDVMIVEPKRLETTIDQVRELKRKLSFKPYEGKWRVVIFPKAETLTIPAANALLKTLEESPDYVVIILITKNPSLLLPTIVSRSQKIQFASLSPSIIKNILTKEEKISLEEAEIISRVSHGSIKKAFDILNEGNIKQKRGNLVKIDAIAKKGSFREIKMAATNLSKEDTTQLLTFLNFLISWYRDILILKAIGKDDLLINYDLIGEIKRRANSLTLEKIIKILKLVVECYEAIKGNANKELSLEILLTKIGEIQ
ncbi:MAG: DNA polymerase III subunit delta' [Deltaproteobacteria bacterium]|nr:DNA polymerase III subunit delta' [Deltaproteobacteria bacterium]RLA91407.1 MAG: DNA polymerase III subunit delta' [Deltaproteobacteria bacterium]